MTSVADSPGCFDLRVERQRHGRLRLWLSGDIGQRERVRIVAALERGAPPTQIYVDMMAVGSVGTAGLGALTHAARLLEPIGERVVLIDPPAHVVNMLHSCQIADEFAIQLTGRPSADPAARFGSSYDRAELRASTAG